MKTQHNAPLFPLFLLMSGGIFFAQYLPETVPIFWGTLSATFLLILSHLLNLGQRSLRGKYLKQAGFYLLFLLLGMSLGQLKDQYPLHKKLEHFNCQETECLATLIKDVKHTPYGQKVWIDVKACLKKGKWQASKGKAILYLPKGDSSSLQKHDQIQLRGYMTTLFSPYSSYLSFLHRKDIHHAIYGKELLKKGRKRSLSSLAHTWQKRSSQRVEQLFEDSTHASLIKAMMLGDKGDLDREIRNDFSTAGLSHVLAISGMHVGIIFLILDKLLFFFAYVRHGYQLKQGVILLLLLAFMMLTGASPAVVRASLMFGAILIGRMAYLRYQSLNIISLTGLIQLLIQPELVFDLGFQLSYLAVLSLIMLYPYWKFYLETGTTWKDAFLASVGVSFIATLATTPLIVSTFGKFPTHFLLSNVLLTLPLSLLIWMGFLTLLLCWLPGVNAVLAWLCSCLIDASLGLIDSLAQLPHAVLNVKSITASGLGMLMIELLVAAVLVITVADKWKVFSRKNSAAEEVAVPA